MKRKMKILAVVSLILYFAMSASAQNMESEEKYLQDIGQLIEVGQVDSAIQKNNEMIINYPESIKAYSSMAFIYTKQDKLKEAITYCNKAISFKTKDLSTDNKESLYRAYGLLANIYSKQKQLGKAIARLRKL